jgi:hypothetical protein
MLDLLDQLVFILNHPRLHADGLPIVVFQVQWRHPVRCILWWTAIGWLHHHVIRVNFGKCWLTSGSRKLIPVFQNIIESIKELVELILDLLLVEILLFS